MYHGKTIQKKKKNCLSPIVIIFNENLLVVKSSFQMFQVTKSMRVTRFPNDILHIQSSLYTLK